MAIGRIDPLKDVHTMLRVAVEVLERVPCAQFLYYGPSSPEQEAYGSRVRTCTASLASASASNSWAARVT